MIQIIFLNYASCRVRWLVTKNTDRESAINKPIINKNKIAVVVMRTH